MAASIEEISGPVCIVLPNLFLFKSQVFVAVAVLISPAMIGQLFLISADFL